MNDVSLFKSTAFVVTSSGVEILSVVLALAVLRRPELLLPITLMWNKSFHLAFDPRPEINSGVASG